MPARPDARIVPSSIIDGLAMIVLAHYHGTMLNQRRACIVVAESVVIVEGVLMRRFLFPLVLFVVLVGFLAVGLRLNPREVPSPLIGKPVPAFRLAQLHAAEKLIAPEDFRGKVWLLNVWASWCVSCRQEHPILIDLDRQKRITIVGLNYKDDRAAAKAWLIQHGGDPYLVSAVDADGRVGIDLGVYGVPETFLIDKNGVIRYKHIGPVTTEALKNKILPLAEELARS